MLQFLDGKMFSYVKGFFKSDLGTIIGSIALVAVFTLVYFFLFYYAKKRNLTQYIVASVVGILILFLVSFVLHQSLWFFVLVMVLMVIFTGVVFFAPDFMRSMFRHSWKGFTRKHTEDVGIEEVKNSVDEIIKACQRMSKMDVGAIIIIADNLADTIVDSGTAINGQISCDLIETVFFPKTALHDGALVIMDNRVLAAGCYLPLTQLTNLPREFGTRHRAAIGVSEAYPSATVIVVSEESGIISAVHDGKIKRYLDADQLRAILNCAFRLSDEGEEVKIWGLNYDE